MKKIIKKIIPRSIRSNAEYVIYFLNDIIDLILNKRESLIPPKWLMFDGPRDLLTYRKNGEEFLNYYKTLCNLKPDERMLDVGCGIGRKTFMLTNYLNENGRYEGFDIVNIGIVWCKNRISKKFPNFHFRKVDVLNKYYNPGGKYKASEYKFPFENEYFDFVVVGSVFTQMLPEDVENYFAEIVRVLKKGGRCLITYYLLNTESLELMAAKKSSLDFKYELGKYRTTDADVPEVLVGYDELFVLELYTKYKLKIIEPVHYGYWCKKNDALSYQDIIIATKL